MGKFAQGLADALGWVMNPIGMIIDEFQPTAHNGTTNPETGEFIYDKTGTTTSPGRTVINDIGNKISDLWNDVTGQTAIDKQNEANMELAQYQTQVQEDLYNKYSSPEALMEQYKQAGLNPNLVYGSAGSGQSNVPSFSSPDYVRRLSKSEQFAKGMSILQSVFNLQSIMYQTSAQRELANQGLLKTLQMNESLRKSRRENTLAGATVGWLGGSMPLFGRRYRRKGDVSGSDPLYDYAGAARSLLFNNALDKMYSNAWKYGNYWDQVNGPTTFGMENNFLGTSYWDWYNKKFAGKQREFNFDWDNDYKTMLKSAGVVSPVIQTLLRLFGNSKF